MADIFFITEGYPNDYVQRYTFLDNLVCAMKDKGVNCVVCNPTSITHSTIHREKMPPRVWNRKTTNGNNVRVFSPRIITFSSCHNQLLRSIIAKLNLITFKRSVEKIIKKYKLEFDVAYGHFITPSALVAVEVAKKKNCISCLAYGENSTYTIDGLGKEYIQEKLKDIDCVVAVSSENKDFLVNNEIVPSPDIVRVFPNGINRKVFYKHDKKEVRRKFGFPDNVFIVAFVGYFTEIKGSKRLSDAIDKIENVYSIFIGNGDYEPTCSNILFKGNLKHEEIGEMLSAADIFVLPTIAEGCCNAIIEAMGCGLPVISSNQRFNDDILNDSCSIRIDTTNIDEIVQAIKRLKDNPDLREKMSLAASEKADTLDIEQRALGIMEWIECCAERKKQK